MGVALLTRAPRPLPLWTAITQRQRRALTGCRCTRRTFAALLAVYLVNGVASAVPATLVLFFIRDRLQAQPSSRCSWPATSPPAPLSMPLWVRAVAPLRAGRSWLAGMALAVAAFAWAATLGPATTWPRTRRCASPAALALGADLVLPGALLAGVIQRAGHAGRLEGAYFGWWNFVTKLNLALAAGIALPTLALFGYSPGSRDADALQCPGTSPTACCPAC